MKRLFVVVFGFLLVSCAGNQSEFQRDQSFFDATQINQSSSISKEPEIPPSSLSAVEPYTGPFHKTELGFFLGAVTIKGFPKREVICNEPNMDVTCKPGTVYVFFRITDGMTPALQEFLEGGRGNSFIRDDAIGLGCETSLEKNQENALILSASEDSPVTLTLNIPFKEPERDVPACHSHFKIVSVTR